MRPRIAPASSSPPLPSPSPPAWVGATPAGSAWGRISGPTAARRRSSGSPGRGDGVLHVIWNRGATPTSIFETRLSSAGKAVGTSTVASGLRRERRSRACSSMPDRTLRLFAAGATHPGSTAYGITTFTAPAGRWKLALQGGCVLGQGPVASSVCRDRRHADEGRPAGHRLARVRRRGHSPRPCRTNAYERRHDGTSQVATDARDRGAVVLAGDTNAGARAASTSSRCSRAWPHASSCRSARRKGLATRR